jgi:hypothetical protein
MGFPDTYNDFTVVTTNVFYVLNEEVPNFEPVNSNISKPNITEKGK